MAASTSLQTRKVAGGHLQPVIVSEVLEPVNIGVGGNPITDANPMSVDVTDRLDRLLGRTTNYDVLSNGTLGALNATVEINASGLGTAGIGITGTWVGTIAVQGNVGDGVWHFLPMIDALTGTAVVTATANGVYQIGVAGFLTIRVLMFAYTSGTATIFIEGTSATAGVFLSKSIPFGVNPIGSVTLTNGEGLTYFDSAAANVNTPAVNTAAVVTYAGVAAQRHYIKGVAWSYNDTPTAGTLIITDGGVTVFHQYVSAAGPGFQEFPGTRGMRCGVNSTVVITLAAAGAAVSGSVSVKGHMVA